MLPISDPRPVLDPLNVPQQVKADAWEAFNSAKDQNDFRARFDNLAIPQEAKAKLWEQRFKAAPAGAEPVAPLVGGPMALAEHGVDMMTGGVKRAIAGFKQMGQPGINPKLGGASEVLRGAGQAIAPMALPIAVAAAPLPTAAALAAGTAGSAVGETGGKALGFSPEGAALTGDITGTLAGGAAGKFTPNLSPSEIASPFAAAISRARAIINKPGIFDMAAGIGEAGAGIGALAEGHPFLGAGLTAAGGAKFQRGLTRYKGANAAPEIPKPPASAPAPAATPEVPQIYQDLAISQAGKRYENLDPDTQTTIRQMATGKAVDLEPRRGGAQPIPQPPPTPPPATPRMTPEAIETLSPEEQGYEHSRLLKEIHSQGRDLNLGPESPAGSPMHLTPTAQTIYKLKSGSELNTKQLAQIAGFLNVHKRLPVPGDVLTGLFKPIK